MNKEVLTQINPLGIGGTDAVVVLTRISQEKNTKSGLILIAERRTPFWKVIAKGEGARDVYKEGDYVITAKLFGDKSGAFALAYDKDLLTWSPKELDPMKYLDDDMTVNPRAGDGL